MKSKKAMKQDLKSAKDVLVYELDVDGVTYELETDIFELDIHNIGILNEQISKIPGQIARMGVIYSEVERFLQKKELSFEIWIADRLVTYFSDAKVYKSEKDKMNNLQNKFKKEYTEYTEDVSYWRKLASTLKRYERGLDAKLQLAQTLSANIRTERSAYTRDMDKTRGTLGDV